MAPPDDGSSDRTLKASIEERFVAPFRRNVLEQRARVTIAIVVGLALHAALLYWLIERNADAQRQVAQQEETPVEVIVEPPKPPDQKKPEEKKEEPKKEAQKPPPKPPEPQKQELEKPATSAPRAPNEEKTETARLDEKTRAPRSEQPPTDGQPKPSTESSSPDEAAVEPPEKTEESAAAKPPDEADKDAEALDKAVPEPPKKPRELARAKPKAKVKADRFALQQLGGEIPLPDWAFARQSKKSPVFGGSEDNRYLAQVFGLIMHHRPPVAVVDPSAFVVVDFTVSDNGTLLNMNISQSSGYAELDSAALTAVARAAPFPPLPPGAPHGLTARISALGTPGAYTLGDR